MGAVVGSTELIVGRSNGSSVGTGVRCVGAAVGGFEGSQVTTADEGSSIGDDGSTVGCAVGCGDGGSVSNTVGDRIGDSEGAKVGSSDGAAL